MTLTELKAALVAAATGNDVAQVLFDWNTVTNETASKSYPYVFWSIDTAEGTKESLENNLKGPLKMNVFCVKQYTPDANRITDYDSLFEDLDIYLKKLNTNQQLTVQERNIDWEVFPEGFVSVDRELAVMYEITLELWC